MEQRRKGKQTREEKGEVRRVSVKRGEREKKRNKKEKNKVVQFFMVFRRSKFGSPRIKVGLPDYSYE